MGARRPGAERRLPGIRRDGPRRLPDRGARDDRALTAVASSRPQAARTFAARAYAAVRAIPVGRVATYGDIAAAAGRPRAWRAVGSLMRTCPDPAIPCHRVVAAGGRLGGYGGREDMKHYLLVAEGVRVVNGRIRGFREVRWSQRR